MVLSGRKYPGRNRGGLHKLAAVKDGNVNNNYRHREHSRKAPSVKKSTRKWYNKESGKNRVSGCLNSIYVIQSRKNFHTRGLSLWRHVLWPRFSTDSADFLGLVESVKLRTA